MLWMALYTSYRKWLDYFPGDFRIRFYSSHCSQYNFGSLFYFLLSCIYTNWKVTIFSILCFLLFILIILNTIMTNTINLFIKVIELLPFLFFTCICGFKIRHQSVSCSRQSFYCNVPLKKSRSIHFSLFSIILQT